MLLPYILTAVFTIITGLIVWRITKEKLSLTYSLTESDSFPSDGGSGKYYIIKIKNEGTKPIESISVDFIFSKGKIAFNKITDERLISKLEQTDSQIKFVIELLNPKEEINCVVTVKEGQDASVPNIKIRGKGITATDKAHSENKLTIVANIYYFIALGAVIFFIAQFSITIFSSSKDHIKFENIHLESGKLDSSLNAEKERFAKIQQKAKEQEQRLKNIEDSINNGQPDRLENIFSLLNKAGLSNIFPKIIKYNEDISYVGTAFYLMHSYLKDTKNKEKYINGLKGISMIDGIAPSSKGVTYYLIGKIEQKSGSQIAADEYFQKCKQETPLMYQHLMEQDKYYDLNSIQKWLLNNEY